VSYVGAAPDVQGDFRELVEALLAPDAARPCALPNASIARTAKVILPNTPGLASEGNGPGASRSHVEPSGEGIGGSS